MSKAIVIDGHVHYHPCFGVQRFCDSAARHFAQASRRLDLPADTPGCLFFSEGNGARYFEMFARGELEQQTSNWRVQETNENCSFVAVREDGAKVVMIAGRQIITAERIEVLAQGCARYFPDGMPLEAVIDSSLAAGALTVLPWGVGKWCGKRGKLIERAMESDQGERLFLGDNGGRPGGTPTPALFRKAGHKGMTILPGTDPLPLPWQVNRVGSFGYVLPCAIDLLTPAAHIKRVLETQQVQPQRYGSLAGPIQFIRANVGLRLAKNNHPAIKQDVHT